MSSVTKLPKRVVVYTDGASRGNPGPASFGYVIKSTEGQILVEHGEALGSRTNNFAEYTALIKGLEACLGGGASEVLVRADSQFMIRQMLGEYKVKAEGIIPLFKECQKLVNQFSRVDFEHIPREQNEEADGLANQALDRSKIL